MQRDPFDRPELGLALADDNIQRLADRIEEFAADCEWETFTQDQQSHRAYCLRMNNATPVRLLHDFTQIAGDLKHILDQAVHASYMMQTGKISEAIHFPTGRTESDFKSELKRRCIKPGVASDVIAVIIDAKPYERGDGKLYELAKFARHKHRDFLRAAPNLRSVGINDGYIDQMSIQALPLETEGEFQFATEPYGAKNIDLNFQWRWNFSIKEPGPFMGAEVISSLQEMTDISRALVASIKSAI